MPPDRNLIRLLAAIADSQPCDRVPEVEGLTPSQRDQAMSLAAKARWINIHSTYPYGRLPPGQVLMLTEAGEKALKEAIDEQDRDAQESTGADLETRKLRRSALMSQLSAMSDGDTGRGVPIAMLGRALGWSEGEVMGVLRYLRERRFVAYRDLGSVRLTAEGLDDLEKASSPQSSGTDDLASIRVGHISNSVVQIGSGGNVSNALPASAPPPGESKWGARLRRIISDSPRQIIVAALGILLAGATAAVLATLTGSGGNSGRGSSSATTGAQGGGSARSSVTSGGTEMAAFKFDDLGSIASSIISVYPGVTESQADRKPSGTFRSGQTAEAVCRTNGRTVISDPSANEAPRQSDVWLQVPGPSQAYYATVTYTDISAQALAALPACTDVP